MKLSTLDSFMFLKPLKLLQYMTKSIYLQIVYNQLYNTPQRHLKFFSPDDSFKRLGNCIVNGESPLVTGLTGAFWRHALPGEKLTVFPAKTFTIFETFFKKQPVVQNLRNRALSCLTFSPLSIKNENKNHANSSFNRDYEDRHKDFPT